MQLKTFSKIQISTYLLISMLIIQSKTFHIATKIRSKALCGQKLINTILNQCTNSDRTNVPNILSPNMESEDQNFNSEDNSICCHGMACQREVIEQYCDFW